MKGCYYQRGLESSPEIAPLAHCGERLVLLRGSKDERNRFLTPKCIMRCGAHVVLKIVSLVQARPGLDHKIQTKKGHYTDFLEEE